MTGAHIAFVSYTESDGHRTLPTAKIGFLCPVILRTTADWSGKKKEDCANACLRFHDGLRAEFDDVFHIGFRFLGFAVWIERMCVHSFQKKKHPELQTKCRGMKKRE